VFSDALFYTAFIYPLIVLVNSYKVSSSNVGQVFSSSEPVFHC